MQISDIKVGHTYAGKGGDSDKTRKVLSINPARKTALTQVYREGQDLGESAIDLRLLASWAAADVTEVKHEPA